MPIVSIEHTEKDPNFYKRGRISPDSDASSGAKFFGREDLVSSNENLCNAHCPGCNARSAHVSDLLSSNNPLGWRVNTTCSFYVPEQVEQNDLGPFGLVALIFMRLKKAIRITFGGVPAFGKAMMISSKAVVINDGGKFRTLNQNKGPDIVDCPVSAAIAREVLKIDSEE